MPAAFPLDTLDYARKLEAAGVPKAQAELQARALNDALASSIASRGDLSNLEQAIDGKFAGLEAKIDARFQKVDARFDDIESRFNARFDDIDAKFDKVDLKSASLESRLDARIGSVELKLAGKIETLHWMVGVVVAMNAAVLVQLILK
jgi:hypothetical protein